METAALDTLCSVKALAHAHPLPPKKSNVQPQLPCHSLFSRSVGDLLPSTSFECMNDIYLLFTIMVRLMGLVDATYSLEPPSWYHSSHFLTQHTPNIFQHSR